MEAYVKCLNDNLDLIQTRGPYSKYDIKDNVKVDELGANDLSRGTVELTWGQGVKVARLYEGIAVDLKSPGHKALVQATAEQMGRWWRTCRRAGSTYSWTGSD